MHLERGTLRLGTDDATNLEGVTGQRIGSAWGMTGR